MRGNKKRKCKHPEHLSAEWSCAYWQGNSLWFTTHFSDVRV